MPATSPHFPRSRALPPGNVSRGWKWIVGLVLALGLGSALLASEPAVSGVGEYQLKANFLLRFLDFVHWPALQTAQPPATITIGVLGADPFGSELAKAVRQAHRDSRPLTWKACRDLEEAKQCHLVFVSRRDAREYPALVNSLAALPILTVGEGTEFARQGGMVGLVNSERRIQIEINTNRASRAGLRIDPHLLQMARIVRDEAAGLPIAK